MPESAGVARCRTSSARPDELHWLAPLGETPISHRMYPGQRLCAALRGGAAHDVKFQQNGRARGISTPP